MIFTLNWYIIFIVRVIYIINYKISNDEHIWNLVYLDEKWYHLDLTWDDPIITGGGRVTDTIKYAYFLKGSDEFFKDHFEDGNIVDGASFKYPTISKVNY